MKEITILYLLIGTVLFSACDDKLNSLPSEKKVYGNVIIDQSSAEVALNGVYYRFAECGKDRDVYSVQYTYNHEIIPALLTGVARYAFGAIEIENNSTVSPSGNYNAGIWKASYELINAANGVIEQIEDLSNNLFSENRKTEIIAESKFMRAYGHYNLLRYYAQHWDYESEYGVLIRDEFVTTDNLSKSRDSVKHAYDFIIEDLEFAISNSPVANKNIYVNQWIAKGLLARVLIMRNQEGDYNRVVTLTSDIIENGPYELEDYTLDIFKIKGASSNEVMLATSPFTDQINKHDVYGRSDRAVYYATDFFQDMLENDPRRDDLIGFIGTDTIKAVIKYYDGAHEELNYPMRLTEMHLLKAEANIRAGGDIEISRSILKTIKQHSGVIDFTEIDKANREDMLIEIYKEIYINLSFEDGIEWTALSRLPMDDILYFKPALINSMYLILPIPALEFEKNPLIGEQNPGYAKI